jgi:hypothetical protein
MPEKKAGPIYQLKVTLLDTSPPVWRRLLIPANATLEELHLAIQGLFSWENYHMHQFITKDRTYYSHPEFGLNEHMPVKDETQTLISSILKKERDTVVYMYDFGDSWEHKIALEKIEERQPRKVYPACIDGKRMAPPEDCGGAPGFEHFVEVVSDPKNPERKDLLEWLGKRKFDPEAFDPKKTTTKVRQFISGL